MTTEASKSPKSRAASPSTGRASRRATGAPNFSCPEKTFPLVQDLDLGFFHQFVFFHQSGCAADPFMDAAGGEPVATGLSLLSSCCQLLCDPLPVFLNVKLIVYTWREFRLALKTKLWQLATQMRTGPRWARRLMIAIGAPIGAIFLVAFLLVTVGNPHSPFLPYYR
jgi:hypothetical protein